MESRELEYLLDGAAWQDSLLQSYRSLHVTIQSILLAIAAGLFIAIIGSESALSALLAFVALVSMWLLQRHAKESFHGVVLSRGEDVNYWHRQIIIAEQQVDASRRHFTKFKVHQKLRRDENQYLQDIFLSSNRKIEPEDVEKLIHKGLGHTRKVVDEQLFQHMSRIWNALVLLSFMWVLLKIYPFLFGVLQRLSEGV